MNIHRQHIMYSRFFLGAFWGINWGTTLKTGTFCMFFAHFCHFLIKNINLVPFSAFFNAPKTPKTLDTQGFSQKIFFIKKDFFDIFCFSHISPQLSHKNLYTRARARMRAYINKKEENRDEASL